MILISNVILFNLFIIFFFYIIGEFLNSFKLNIFKSIIFGYSVFLILTYFLYFFLKIDVNKIVMIWQIFFLFSFAFYLKVFFKLKKKVLINNFLIFLILFISIIYILPAHIYGEQFYVFRGNHWDLFNYLSLGSLFNNYDFSILIEDGKFPAEFKYFNQIEQLIFSRPLASLLIAIFINIFDLDIFLIPYLLKVILILLSAISFKSLIDNIKISYLNKIIITLAFTLSFWLIYIFEIEAVSHLASIPIFLVIISDLLKFEKFENFDVKYIFYFSILNCGLFLIYPELFCICSIICGIYLFEKFLKSNKKMNFLKSITLILLIFFLITLPSYKTNYMFLMNQLNLSLDSSKDWWGYFGSFVLGKENLVQNQNFVLQIKDYFLNHNLFQTLKYIVNLHFENGYHFFLLNLVPSFFGLYFISVAKVSSFLDWINLFLLICVLTYLLNISMKNILILKKNKTISLIFLFLTLFASYILIRGNLWVLIKLYTFLSPFIFVFIIVNFYKKNNKGNLSVNYFLIFLLILFPIYKYTSLNHGIGKLDSFPSIMKPEMKKDVKWNINIEEIKKCNYIIVDIEDYFKKSYLKLKFLNNSINSNITNFEYKPIDKSIECYLTFENGKFNISL